MRLLLDAHVSPAVARALSGEGFDVLALQTWHVGEYRDASDERILAAAYLDGCTLVTYDCRTIPDLLKEWAENGQHHGGVVLVDERTISPSDVGGLVRALRMLVERTGQEAWTDRVVYLRLV